MNHERGNILVIVVAVAALVLILSLFKTDHDFFDIMNAKSLLRLDCGLTMRAPKFAPFEKAQFPLSIEGYINGCGWDATGSSAGTAQVFDGTGLPVTKPTTMVISKNSKEAPYYFSANLTVIAAPTTDGGNILLRSNAGLLSSIPIAF